MIVSDSLVASDQHVVQHESLLQPPTGPVHRGLGGERAQHLIDDLALVCLAVPPDDQVVHLHLVVEALEVAEGHPDAHERPGDSAAHLGLRRVAFALDDSLADAQLFLVSTEVIEDVGLPEQRTDGDFPRLQVRLRLDLAEDRVKGLERLLGRPRLLERLRNLEPIAEREGHTSQTYSDQSENGRLGAGRPLLTIVVLGGRPTLRLLPVTP